MEGIEIGVTAEGLGVDVRRRCVTLTLDFLGVAIGAREDLGPLPIGFGADGSWLVDGTPCGLSIREDENPITGNTSRFLPHAIV